MQVEIRNGETRAATIVERKEMIDQNFNQAAAEAFRVLTGELKRKGWASIRERIGICSDEAGRVADALIVIALPTAWLGGKLREKQLRGEQ
ncbi:MAG: hypothetical protein ACKVZH_10680 [Blastocatellia bacterium]